MIVDINKPEVQAEMARQAAAQGGAIEAYAAMSLEEAAQRPSGANGTLSPAWRSITGASADALSDDAICTVRRIATSRARPKIPEYVSVEEGGPTGEGEAARDDGSSSVF
jgi:hypothetical protein